MKTKLKPIFQTHPQVGVVYLFGSTAEKKRGPLSDYDFGVYLIEKNLKKRFDLRLKLREKITRVLKTEKVDVLILNDIENLGLKYQIIKKGRVIFEREPFRVLIEPQIMSQYFDFQLGLQKYGLTKS